MLRYLINLRLLCICVFVLIHMPASAQEGGAQGLVFRMLTFDRVKALNEIYLATGKESVAIKMHKNNFIGPFRTQSRHLQFFKFAPAEGEKPVSAGSVIVPESMGGRVILVAIPSGNGVYRFFPIADDRSEFKAGEMVLINLSQVTILANLNEKNYQVKSGSVRSVPRLSVKTKPHTYPAVFYYRSNDKWNPFTSTYWLHEPDVRNLAFCYPDSKTKRIRIKTIRELPKAKTDP